MRGWRDPMRRNNGTPKTKDTKHKKKLNHANANDLNNRHRHRQAGFDVGPEARWEPSGKKEEGQCQRYELLEQLL